MGKSDGFEGRITEARPSEAARLLVNHESGDVDGVRVDIRETLGGLFETMDSVEAVRLPPETKSIVIKHLVPLILRKFNIRFGKFNSQLLAYLLEVGEGVTKSSSELYAYYHCPVGQLNNLRSGFGNSLLSFQKNGLIKVKRMGAPAPQYFSLKHGVIGLLAADQLKSALKDAATEISKGTGSRLSAETIMKYFLTLTNLNDEPNDDLDAIEAVEQIGWPEAVIDIVTRYLIFQSLRQLNIKDTKFHHTFADFLLLRGEGVSSTPSELFDWYGAIVRKQRTLASQGFSRSMDSMGKSGVVQVTPLPGHTCMESFTLLPGKWPLLEDARWQDAVRQILKRARHYIRPPFSLEMLRNALMANDRSIPELVAFLRTQRMPANAEAAVVAIDRSLAIGDSTSVPVIADSRREICESTPIPTNGGGDAMLVEEDEPAEEEDEAAEDEDEPEAADDEESDLAQRIAARAAADIIIPDYVLEQLTDSKHPIHKLGVGNPFRLPEAFASRMEVCKLLPEGKPLIDLLRAFDFDCNAWRQHHVLFYFEGGNVKIPKLRLLRKTVFNPTLDGIPFSDL